MSWLRSHPWIITAFAMGVAVGLLVCLPLFPVQFPDGVGDVLGALVGTALAVFGGAWLANFQRDRQRREARDAVEYMLDDAVAALDRLIEATQSFVEQTNEEAAQDAERFNVVTAMSQSAVAFLTSALHRAERMGTLFQEAGPLGALVHADVTTMLRDAQIFANTGTNGGLGTLDMALPKSPSWQGFFTGLQQRRLRLNVSRYGLASRIPPRTLRALVMNVAGSAEITFRGRGDAIAEDNDGLKDR